MSLWAIDCPAIIFKNYFTLVTYFNTVKYPLYTASLCIFWDICRSTIVYTNLLVVYLLMQELLVDKKKNYSRFFLWVAK